MSTRREFLYGTGATLFAASAPAAATSGPAPIVAPTIQGGELAKLSATLTLADGKAHRFVASSGLDLGDFEVPFAGIAQRNVIAKSEDGLFSVFFRPDRNGKRVEVVVLFGHPLSSAPSTMGPYTFEIFENGASLAKIEVPQHFWLARWRWQSAQRPRIRAPADIVSAKQSVAYARTSMTEGMPRSAKPYVVMGASNITLFMGQTGERSDIGQLPDYAAAYMATGDGDAYDSMMAWAEASASGPWHINDPHTNAILNWDNWGRSTTYTDQPQQAGAEMHLVPNPFPKSTCIRPDAAHHPCLSFIPFLSTGDPFHAEELQYQINYYFGAEHGSNTKLYIFDTLQARGWAWMLRSTVFARVGSTLIRSRNLLPTEFWDKVLSHNLSWVTEKFVNGTSAKERVFFSGTSKEHMGWWQEDYLCAVLATTVRLGLREWLPVLSWKIQSDINRLNGTSGWPKTHPTIYYAQYFEGKVTPGPRNIGNGSVGTIGYEPRSTPVFGNWSIEFNGASTFSVFRPGHKLERTGTIGKKYSSGGGPAFIISEGNTPFATGDIFALEVVPISTWSDLARVNGVTESSDGSLQNSREVYMAHLYAVLALASPLLPEVKPLFEWLSDAMRDAGGRIPWRDSFAV